VSHRAPVHGLKALRRWFPRGRHGESYVNNWCRCPIIGSPPPQKSPPADNLLAKIRPARRPPGRADFYR